LDEATLLRGLFLFTIFKDFPDRNSYNCCQNKENHEYQQAPISTFNVDHRSGQKKNYENYIKEETLVPLQVESF
jgi:hypothetical protein